MEGLATALGNFVEEAQGLSAQFDPQVVFYIGPGASRSILCGCSSLWP